MKKILAILVMVFVVNLGIALADAPHLGDDTNDLDNSAPVGSHIVPEDAPGHPGLVNGFNEDTNAVAGITHNPLCPLHPSD